MKLNSLKCFKETLLIFYFIRDSSRNLTPIFTVNFRILYQAVQQISPSYLEFNWYANLWKTSACRASVPTEITTTRYMIISHLELILFRIYMYITDMFYSKMLTIVSITIVMHPISTGCKFDWNYQGTFHITQNIIHACKAFMSWKHQVITVIYIYLFMWNSLCFMYDPRSPNKNMIHHLC